MWEELDSLNTLPTLSNTTNEVQTFLTALSTQKIEQKLFQFLNGLDESYSPHRSHILLMQPLPSIDEAHNLLQQEESQRDVLLNVKGESDALVMYGRSTGDIVHCSLCGKPGHHKDKCWSVVGYPSWHALSSTPPVRGRGFSFRSRGGRWPRASRGGRSPRPYSNEVSSTPTLSPSQIELIKLLPTPSSNPTVSEEEFDTLYARMAICSSASFNPTPWILDFGASDHMTGQVSLLTNPHAHPYHNKITLPNGHILPLSTVLAVYFSHPPSPSSMYYMSLSSIITFSPSLN